MDCFGKVEKAFQPGRMGPWVLSCVNSILKCFLRNRSFFGQNRPGGNRTSSWATGRHPERSSARMRRTESKDLRLNAQTCGRASAITQNGLNWP